MSQRRKSLKELTVIPLLVCWVEDWEYCYSVLHSQIDE